MPDINVEGQKRGSDFVKAEDYMDLNVVAVAGDFACNAIEGEVNANGNIYCDGSQSCRNNIYLQQR